MEPIISTKGKLAQLRYELPHRAHDAKIYPTKAPNGSTIILYGHATGVGILWRGGRPLKQALPPPKQPAKPTKVNGTSNDVIMIIDSDDEAPPGQSAPQPPEEAEFESEDEELDPDAPYPTIIQHLRLSLNTEVLHIAIPDIPAVSSTRLAESFPAIFGKKIVFVVACADYSIRIVTLPLSPPSAATKDAPLNSASPWGEDIAKIGSHTGHQSIPRGVTITWTSRAEPTFDERADDDMEADPEEDPAATPRRRRSPRKQSRSRSRRRSESEGFDLLIASHSAELGGLLKIWRFPLTETAVTVANPVLAYQTLNLRTPASRVVFNSATYPRRRHSQLLITDTSGIARIYDPFAISSRQRRGSQLSRNMTDPGAYVALFRTAFETLKSDVLTPPVLATRKPIIDAAWAADGHHIVALLADGEWGIWDSDRSGPSPPIDPSSFSVRGFVGNADLNRASIAATSPKTRNSRNTLAPMTPNTRRVKQETLFSGVAATSSTPSRGGISIASLHSPTGDGPEDSVIIWYGSEVYRVPNLAQWWSRTASGGGGGSLHGSGLSRIQGLALYGEAITVIDQFDTTTRDARMAIPRDSLILTDYRLIITASTASKPGLNLMGVFEQERAEEEEIRKTDQALLARGALDLGGMDRLLEDMDGSGSASRTLVLGNSRKVLFASSTN
ncbi:uncharacterized protein BDR25DRAFT_327795 [Lindgomyces ingoldianus]|uniref:Uncharacterized protein n=1 Tax=Lindgomyces ingoldianus TaxID=673940 RepID=A0ACB6QKS5_9PLEO|nr:uncharacterized protein BDR25DRAFT_327795 [Lindgomyces ingoldianus]KAF2466717.1 hypothetical protein BDR25DRAFT_327795 [Lindgomyces ingoldianus]